MAIKNPTKPTKRRLKGYGPAMAALSPMQRRYVELRYENALMTEFRCVELAGYKGKYDAIKKMAYRLKNNPLVQAAMKEAGETIYRDKLPITINAIDNIIRDPKHRDHAKVLHGLLDRVGMHAVTETKTTVTHQIDRADLLVKLAALMEKHNLLTLPQPVVKSGDTVGEAGAAALTARGEAEDSSE